MKGVIYKYTFPDGKVYIGQTRRNPELRHKEHLNPIKRNRFKIDTTKADVNRQPSFVRPHK